AAAARTRLASARSETKKVLQPDLANVAVIGPMPQPQASALTTAAHSLSARLTSACQLNAMAVKLILRIPPASASGGPSTVTSSAAPLLLTTSLPPLFI